MDQNAAQGLQDPPQGSRPAGSSARPDQPVSAQPTTSAAGTQPPANPELQPDTRFPRATSPDRELPARLAFLAGIPPIDADEAASQQIIYSEMLSTQSSELDRQKLFEHRPRQVSPHEPGPSLTAQLPPSRVEVPAGSSAPTARPGRFVPTVPTHGARERPHESAAFSSTDQQQQPNLPAQISERAADDHAVSRGPASPVGDRGTSQWPSSVGQPSEDRQNGAAGYHRQQQDEAEWVDAMTGELEASSSQHMQSGNLETWTTIEPMLPSGAPAPAHSLHYTVCPLYTIRALL